MTSSCPVVLPPTAAYSPERYTGAVRNVRGRTIADSKHRRADVDDRMQLHKTHYVEGIPESTKQIEQIYAGGPLEGTVLLVVDAWTNMTSGAAVLACSPTYSGTDGISQPPSEPLSNFHNRQTKVGKVEPVWRRIQKSSHLLPPLSPQSILQHSYTHPDSWTVVSGVGDK